ncbi:MAG: tetratricopeptide repeat protein, partial [Cyanobacteria bacterium REEB65]|nr:tetratricopeptide repeat protein [Cyanobacteria bacterium REEB65]
MPENLPDEHATSPPFEPATAEIRLELAAAQLANGDATSAVSLAHEILLESPSHPLAAGLACRAHAILAKEAAKAGREAIAADHWRAASRFGKFAKASVAVAHALEEAGDLLGAQRTYEALLLADERDTAALLWLGESALEHEDPAGARRFFRQLVAVEPDNIRGLFALADLAWAEGQHEDSFALYERIVELAPEHIPTVLAFAREAQEAGQQAETWKYAQCILSQQPQHAEALVLAKAALWASLPAAEPAPAAIWLQQWLTYCPADTAALRALIAVHRKLGDLDRATQTARKLAELDPVNPAASLCIAEFERRRGDLVAARQALAAAAEAGDSRCLLELSALERAAGNLPEVRRNLELLLERTPTDPEALASIAEIDLLEGRSQAAWQRQEALLEQGMATPFGRKVAGEAARALARSHEGPAALSWWNRCLSALGNDREAARALFGAYLQAGERERAARVASLLLDSDRDATLFLAEYHADRNDWEQVSRILAGLADDADSAYLLAKIAWQGGDAAKANAHLDQVLQVSPRHREAAILRAQLASDAGDDEAAFAILSELLVWNPRDHAAWSLLTAHCRDAVRSSAGSAYQS